MSGVRDGRRGLGEQIEIGKQIDAEQMGEGDFSLLSIFINLLLTGRNNGPMARQDTLKLTLKLINICGVRIEESCPELG